jgi:hypothetical protein
MKNKQMRKMNTLLAGAALLVVSLPLAAADQPQPAVDGEGYLALHFSDGSKPALGLEAVNARLREIGVRVGEANIPEAAKPVLRASRTRAVTTAESEKLLELFHLGRRELLEEIAQAGREPEMHRGGYLQTSEIGVPPYPKVYDMKALDGKTTAYLKRKFGKLHVNSSDAGVGIDEVMTIISGGPYTWFFVFEGGVVGKLRLGSVSGEGKAWRISYPGLVPHGGFFDAEHGLVIAFAHGPEHFVMRYEDTSVDGYETLNDNPWIDFSVEPPVLMDKPKSESAENPKPL